MNNIKKHKESVNTSLFKFIHQLILKRSTMRMRLIRQRRTFLHNQMQQSYILFQKSIFSLMQHYNAELLKIVLQELESDNHVKIKVGSEVVCKKKPKGVPVPEDNINELIIDNFLERFHITEVMFNDICNTLHFDKSSQKFFKYYLFKIANVHEEDSIATNKISIESSENEIKICSEINDHFSYSCNSMTIYECEEAKNKFSALCGIKVCGILVDFEFNFSDDEKFRSFVIIDHKKRFRNLSEKNLSKFLKEVENYSSKSSINYFFSDIRDSQSNKNILLYADKIGKVPCAKIINFKQYTINELLERWKYLTSEQKCTYDIFRTCIILHNLCKNRSVPVP